MIDKNTLARFILANDFSGDGLLTNEEFFTVESKFFNKDLSGLFDMPLWKIVPTKYNPPFRCRLINSKELPQTVWMRRPEGRGLCEEYNRIIRTYG